MKPGIVLAPIEPRFVGSVMSILAVIFLITGTASAAPKATELNPSSDIVSGLPGQEVPVSFTLTETKTGNPVSGASVVLYRGNSHGEILDTGRTNHDGVVTFFTPIPDSGDEKWRAIFTPNDPTRRVKSHGDVIAHRILAIIGLSGWHKKTYPNSQIFEVFLTFTVQEVDAAGRILGPLSGHEVVGIVRSPVAGPGNTDGGSALGVTNTQGQVSLTVRCKLSANGKSAILIGWHGFSAADGFHIVDRTERRVGL